MKFFIMAVFSFNLFAYGQESYVRFPTVCLRTPQVKDAIVEKLKGNVDSNINCNLADHFLDQIRVLFLSERGIESLKVGDFSGLTSLRWLYLDNNKLSNLPVGIFSGLVSLRKLYLDNNKLSNLPVGVFSGLTSLFSLYLENNDLSNLPVGIFSGLTSLRWLNLGDNSLSIREEGRLREELPHTTIIDFDPLDDDDDRE